MAACPGDRLRPHEPATTPPRRAVLPGNGYAAGPPRQSAHLQRRRAPPTTCPPPFRIRPFGDDSDPSDAGRSPIPQSVPRRPPADKMPTTPLTSPVGRAWRASRVLGPTVPPNRTHRRCNATLPEPLPAGADRVASLDTAATAKVGQLRGGRGRSRARSGPEPPQVRPRPPCN